MLHWLDPDDPNAPFPPLELAETDPDGLLAVGGDLSPQRLQRAYSQGIFPWYTDDQPILWWSPDPRTVLYPEGLRISRSLKKTLRNHPFNVTFDTAFEATMRACSEPRGDDQGTWITDEMLNAYCQLNRLGYAHSVEVWQEQQLVGGLYGVAIGKVFFGESMFSRVTDASKVALVHLSRQLLAWDFRMIDCQVYSPHLASLGAEVIPRKSFSQLLDQWCSLPDQPGSWQGRSAAFDGAPAR